MGAMKNLHSNTERDKRIQLLIADEEAAAYSGVLETAIRKVTDAPLATVTADCVPMPRVSSNFWPARSYGEALGFFKTIHALRGKPFPPSADDWLYLKKAIVIWLEEAYMELKDGRA
jgi:hypothetical protein